MDKKLITVTSPLLPNLDDFHAELQKIWDSKWITNNGDYHKKLEAALAEYLKVPYVSLFTNGTLPLLTALQALRVTGEVITTPYSFVATTHSIWWNGCKPVFVDIDPATGDLDPNKIEAACIQDPLTIYFYAKSVSCIINNLQAILICNILDCLGIARFSIHMYTLVSYHEGYQQAADTNLR